MYRIYFSVCFFLIMNVSYANNDIDSFIGTWNFEDQNGTETLKISSKNDVIKILYLSWSDGYQERFISDLKIEKNLITGSFWGQKNNVKIRLVNNKVLLTIDPWHFASIIDKQFNKIKATETSPYLLPNEKELFSFYTQTNKIMSLCYDTTYKYLVYRFGSKDNVELQFPRVLDETSWDKFFYYSYHRGGGVDLSIDEASILFSNNGFKYIVRYDWSIDKNGQHTSVEIEIDELSTKKDRDFVIKGQSKTISGGIQGLRHKYIGELINSLDKEEQKKIYSGWKNRKKYILGDKKVSVYEKPTLEAKNVTELNNGSEVIVCSEPFGSSVNYLKEGKLQLWSKFVSIKFKEHSTDSTYNWGFIINDYLSNYKPLFLSNNLHYNSSEHYLIKELNIVPSKDDEMLIKTKLSSFRDYYNEKRIYRIDSLLYTDFQLNKIAPYFSSSIKKSNPSSGSEQKENDHFELLYSFNGTVDLSPNFYSIIVGYDFYHSYEEYIINYTKDGQLIDFLKISSGDNVESFEYTESCFSKHHVLINKYTYSDNDKPGETYELIEQTPIYIDVNGVFKK